MAAPLAHGASKTDAQNGLAESEYRRIKQMLCFDRHYGVTLLLHLVDAVLFAFGLWLVSLERLDTWLAAQVLFTVVFWHGFAILHDCGHSAAAKSRTLNALSGSWASLFCFMPYYPWKLVHHEHHQWTGNLEHDPVARGLRQWRRVGSIPLWIRAAWRSWIPALALFQHVVLWSYPVQVARADGVISARFARCLLSVALLPAAYALAHALAPQLFCLRSFAGALVLYLALTELINLPHHSDRPFGFSQRLRPWEQWRAARSCAYPPLLAKLLLLNFNLHVEHHLFPTLPWYQLPQARAQVRPALGSAYEEAIGAEWNLRNRSRDLHDVLLAAPAAPPT